MGWYRELGKYRRVSGRIGGEKKMIKGEHENFLFYFLL